jgi:hypothetical protein
METMETTETGRARSDIGPSEVSDDLVAAVLGRMRDIVEPEQERGGHPRGKAGWIRQVLAAAWNAGYVVARRDPAPLFPFPTFGTSAERPPNGRVFAVGRGWDEVADVLGRTGRGWRVRAARSGLVWEIEWDAVGSPAHWEAVSPPAPQ